MIKTIDMQPYDAVYRFNDLNQLFDAVEFFKPKTIANYAKAKNISPQAVYKQLKNQRLCHINIDGVIFII